MMPSASLPIFIRGFMPQVIAVLNQKGGAGKTTIATNLAHALLRDGHKVLLVDADPQGSLRDWNEVNGGNLLPVVGLDRETLAKDLTAVSVGYDYILIDGAPQIARLSAAAVKAADLVLIPVQHSPYDIWACADLIQARRSVANGQPLAYFVISRAIKNSKLSTDVVIALRDYEMPVLKSFTTQRVIYPTSAAEGKTVFQREPSGPAAQEIEAIAQEIKEVLHVTHHQTYASQQPRQTSRPRRSHA